MPIRSSCAARCRLLLLQPTKAPIATRAELLAVSPGLANPHGPGSRKLARRPRRWTSRMPTPARRQPRLPDSAPACQPLLAQADTVRSSPPMPTQRRAMARALDLLDLPATCASRAKSRPAGRRDLRLTASWSPASCRPASSRWPRCPRGSTKTVLRRYLADWQEPERRRGRDARGRHDRAAARCDRPGRASRSRRWPWPCRFIPARRGPNLATQVIPAARCRHR